MLELENKIKDNVAYFNDNEPDEGHELRFAQKLNHELHSEPKRKFLSYWKYAAAVLIVFASSYTIINTIDFKSNTATITPIVFSYELQEIQDYYDDNAKFDLDKIDEIITDEKQAEALKAKAEEHINKIDAKLVMIEKEYVKNPDCERLKAAIINGNRMKKEVVDDIVKQAGNAQVNFRAGSVYSGI